MGPRPPLRPEAATPGWSKTRTLLTLVASCLLWAACQGPASEAAVRAASSPAAQADAGAERAPDWVLHSETYAIDSVGASWEALAASKVAFVTHCPISAEYFRRVHALGIRAIPYVTFYQSSAERRYQGVDLRQHADFMELDEAGRPKRSQFWQFADGTNCYVMCPNVAAYQDAMVAWVRHIMELGADGVFVDNLMARAPCAGPRYGRHEHLYASQDEAFAKLLERVRAVVKHYKPDGAVLGNSAAPTRLPAIFWPQLDADMLESYIVSWASPDRQLDWRGHWHAQALALQPLLAAGKQIQALSYLGHTPHGILEDAFFTYASARLAGFVWNGGLALDQPDAAILYQIRLGRPLGPEAEEDGVFFRAFERGFVALNPDQSRAGTITIKPPLTPMLVDLAAQRAVHWSSPPGVTVASGAGRQGSNALRMDNSSAGRLYALQTVTLNQRAPAPVVASAFSKCVGTSRSPNADYSIYLDVTFVDDDHLWGQNTPFSCPSNEWQRQEVVVTPEKPIKSIGVNLLFRNQGGVAFFDDVSAKQATDPGHDKEWISNGSFEHAVRSGLIVDTSRTAGKVTIPPYSGRVFLYAAATDKIEGSTGPTLVLTTEPALGEVHFRVDGFDYWTHGARVGSGDVPGTDVGRVVVVFQQSGKHMVELEDVSVDGVGKSASGAGAERHAQKTGSGPLTEDRPANRLRFKAWRGPMISAERRVEVTVDREVAVTAEFSAD